MLAKLIDFLLCRFTSLSPVCARKKMWNSNRRIKHRLYFANHNSHGDFILLWVSLPYQVRKKHPPGCRRGLLDKRADSSFLGVQRVQYVAD